MKRVATTINLAARCWLDAAPAKSKLKILKRRRKRRRLWFGWPPLLGHWLGTSPYIRCFSFQERQKIPLLEEKKERVGIFNAGKMQFLILHFCFHPTRRRLSNVWQLFRVETDRLSTDDDHVLGPGRTKFDFEKT
jgi:hypothetical protein